MYYGLKECPKALIEMLDGKNIGKCIVELEKEE